MVVTGCPGGGLTPLSKTCSRGTRFGRGGCGSTPVARPSTDSRKLVRSCSSRDRPKHRPHLEIHRSHTCTRLEPPTFGRTTFPSGASAAERQSQPQGSVLRLRFNVSCAGSHAGNRRIYFLVSASRVRRKPLDMAHSGVLECTLKG